MDIESKLEIIKSEPLKEVITDEELKLLLESNDHPQHYLGLEISGMMHLGHLFVGGKKINDFDSVGIKTQVLLADWHTIANNKFGSDWEKIIKASEFYKKAFEKVCPNTKVILGSDLYKNNNEYWKNLMKFAARTTMARATRTLIIQGRSEKDTLHVSQYIYPIMQVNDILALDVDIPHAGMDQRKVHVLAKELFKDMKLKKIVPVHHHLLQSLSEPPKLEKDMSKEEEVVATKMSKSKPGSSISVIATDEEIKKTIKSAWCPEKVIEFNPVLELCQYLILPLKGNMYIDRKKEYGNEIYYTNYKDLENDYRNGKLHPVDLKNGVADAIISIVEPVRDLFKNKEDLLSVFK